MRRGCVLESRERTSVLVVVYTLRPCHFHAGSSSFDALDPCRLKSSHLSHVKSLDRPSSVSCSYGFISSCCCLLSRISTSLQSQIQSHKETEGPYVGAKRYQFVIMSRQTFSARPVGHLCFLAVSDFLPPHHEQPN